MTQTHVFKVGDRVKFWMGRRSVDATVVEDRGFLGHGGEQIIKVRDATDLEFELSASLVTPMGKK